MQPSLAATLSMPPARIVFPFIRTYRRYIIFEQALNKALAKCSPYSVRIVLAAAPLRFDPLPRNTYLRNTHVHRTRPYEYASGPEGWHLTASKSPVRSASSSNQHVERRSARDEPPFCTYAMLRHQAAKHHERGTKPPKDPPFPLPHTGLPERPSIPAEFVSSPRAFHSQHNVRPWSLFFRRQSRSPVPLTVSASLHPPSYAQLR